MHVTASAVQGTHKKGHTGFSFYFKFEYYKYQNENVIV